MYGATQRATPINIATIIEARRPREAIGAMGTVRMVQQTKAIPAMGIMTMIVTVYTTPMIEIPSLRNRVGNSRLDLYG